MSESTGVKAFIKQAQVFNYNVLNRDAWVANQAKLLPQGTPVWLLLLPFMAILAPLSSMFLNPYENKRFTIGYHVTAVRRGDTE